MEEKRNLKYGPRAFLLSQISCEPQSSTFAPSQKDKIRNKFKRKDSLATEEFQIICIDTPLSSQQESRLCLVMCFERVEYEKQGRETFQ